MKTDGNLATLDLHFALWNRDSDSDLKGDPRENDTPRLSTSGHWQAVENLHDDNRAVDVCDQAVAVVNADDAIQWRRP